MEEKVSLEGLDKAEVLAALYNASKPQGKGFVDYDQKPMNIGEAQVILDSGRTNFDYLNGRVMKVDLSGDEFSPWGYDRNNGRDAAQFAITALRATKNPNSPIIRGLHEVNTKASAERVRKELNKITHYERTGEIETLHLGFDDVAHVLEPKIDRSIKKLDELKDK